MKYNIYSETPITFPEICPRCLCETQDYVHFDLQEVQSLGHSMLELLSPVVSLKDVGKSVKLPLCKSCMSKLTGIRWLIVFVFIISIILFIYGLMDKKNDLGMYLWVTGAFLGILCPFLYIFFKQQSLGIAVHRDEKGYIYTFDSDYYPEFLKKEGYISVYEIIY